MIIYIKKTIVLFSIIYLYHLLLFTDQILVIEQTIIVKLTVKLIVKSTVNLSR